jgi:ketosteroid isomerase-like protein
LFLASLLLLAAVAPAGGAAAPGGEAELVRAERDWMQAMQRRDEDRLRALVDRGFALSGMVDADRPPVPASAWLDNALHHLAVESFDFAAIRAEQHGDVGIVRAEYRWRGAYDGEPFDDAGSLVDVWRRRGARWVAVTRLVTPEATAPQQRAALRGQAPPRWNGEPRIAP